MNSRLALYLQAIRGPVLLIVIGTLFLLQQANVFRFSQTWPLLLIVFGVMKLLERTVAPSSPLPPPPGAYRP